MIRLGLRLATSGGREGWTRLMTIAGGVMIGVMLLLLAVSGLQILQISSLQFLNTSAEKACWRCSSSYTMPKNPASLPKDALIWSVSGEIYNGDQISRIDVAYASASAPTIPGIDRTIQPGEYFASPAVIKLLKTVPANQLGDRFPGKLAGEIEPKGLASPGEMIVVIGHEREELLKNFSYATYLTTLQTEPQKRDYGPAIIVMFLVIVGGLLFAIWSLVMAATRLGAARREEKFATLRLFGATPRQIMGIAAVDSALGAAIGATAAVVLFYILQPWLGKSLSQIVDVYPEEFTPGLVGLVMVIAGVLFVSVLSALFSLRRVRISPLGVSRKTTPKPPGAWRVLPLLAGIGILVFVWLVNKDLQDTIQKAEMTETFVLGFGLILVGIALSGSWLTQQITRLFAKLAIGAPSLLAARRLADNPKAAFRSVNVLVIAAFLATLIATLTPLIQPQQSGTFSNNQPAVHQAYFLDEHHIARGGLRLADHEPTLQKLRAIPGVTAVPLYVESVELYDSPFSKDTYFYCRDRASSQFGLFSACNGASPDAVVRVPASTTPAINEEGPPTLEQAKIVSKDISNFPVQSLQIYMEGQAAAERVRTVLAGMPNFGGSWWGMTPQEYRAQDAQLARKVNLLVNGILLIVLFVAGCSLAVSAGGNIVERKRPFGLLRVAGMSIGQLRRVVLYESAVPLVVSAILASGLGFLVGALIITSFAHPDEATVEPLALEFYGLMGLGIGSALLAIAATLPLLNALTKPENARFE